MDHIFLTKWIAAKVSVDMQRCLDFYEYELVSQFGVSLGG